jgi:peroxiredoxin
MSVVTLRAGDPAPRFEVADAWGARVALDDYAGRPLLISFFRNAACAVCNLRLHWLIDRMPSCRAADLAVVAVFESPPARVREEMAAHLPPFPVVADPDGRLYDRFGVEVSAAKVERTMADPRTAAVVGAAMAAGFPLRPDPASNFHRIPADILIGPDGIVRRAHYGDLVTDHLPFEEIDRVLGVDATRPALAASVMV